MEPGGVILESAGKKQVIIAKILQVIALAVIVLLLTHIFYLVFQYLGIYGSDWGFAFRPAALDFMHPERARFPVYAPWVSVFLFPLACLPSEWGRCFIFVVSLVVVVLYVKDWWRALLLSLNMIVLAAMAIGQIDVLLITAFTLPLPLSTIVVATKPIVLGPWLLRQYIKTKEWEALAPLICLIIISVVLFGLWFLDIDITTLGLGKEAASAWPAFVPFGLVLLFSPKELHWLLAGAFFIPYLIDYHLAPIIAYIYKHEQRWWVLVLLTASSWLIAVARLGWV